ncbi:MAG TPA: hypothetical protein PKI15_04375 [Candidatus Cloacimonadota bacterium]|nr:hypothetical protein [Candidatus Cloacimonadota bacterium]
MKVNRHTPANKMSIKFTRRPKYIYCFEQPGISESTPEQKQAIIRFVSNQVILPVLRGEVGIKDVVIPAGGWEKFDANHPGFGELPAERQLEMAIFNR